jgi:putative spermidine/putrescine transport system ATP-binding protein
MNAGRLEQFDKPSQLYALPQTLFVAGFIGQMNILQGEAVKREIRVEGLSLMPSAELEAGPVTVAIRPEDIVLTSKETKGAWAGVLEQIMDLGAYQTVLVTLPHHQLKVMVDKTYSLAEGQAVWITPRRYLVYRKNKAPLEIVSARPVLI